MPHSATQISPTINFFMLITTLKEIADTACSEREENKKQKKEQGKDALTILFAASSLPDNDRQTHEGISCLQHEKTRFAQTMKPDPSSKVTVDPA